MQRLIYAQASTYLVINVLNSQKRKNRDYNQAGIFTIHQTLTKNELGGINFSKIYSLLEFQLSLF